MSVVLDSTLSGDTANSYVTVTYADEYWAQHYSTTKADLWSSLSSTQKQLILVQACRVVETLRFVVPNTRGEAGVYFDRVTLSLRNSEGVLPYRYYSYQALQFPRSIDTDYDTGVPFIPEGAQIAQCEQAVYLMTVDDSIIASKLQGVQHEALSVGGVSTSQTIAYLGSLLSPVALEWVRPYLLKTSSVLRRA